MATREVDPSGPDEVWRRMLALVAWKKPSERAFALWCGLNYNQWNNYKKRIKMPSQGMFTAVTRKTSVHYMWLRYGVESELTGKQEDEILPLLNKIKPLT